MASAPVTAGWRHLASSGQGTVALAAKHDDREQPALDPRLTIRRLVLSGEITWAVRNPDTFKILVFDDSNWKVIELFDGTRSRPEMVDEYNRRHPDDLIGLETIVEFEEALRKMELLDQSSAARNLKLVQKFRDARKRAAEEKAEGFDIFFIMFHVVDPNRFLNKTVKYVRWLWTPPAVAVFSLFALFTLWIFIRDFPTIWAQTVELYSFLRKPLLDIIQFFFILTCIGCIHEYAHAYATKIYGGDVHDIGLALFYFTPAFYCDTSDHLMFANKWHRLWVPMAGIYVESILCCFATTLWIVSYPDTLLHELAYKTMLFTGISTVFFNINPMIKTDGYHALSHLLEMPELREDSFRYVGALAQKKIFRLPVEVPVHSRRKQRAYLIYGSLAVIYTLAIMDLIAHVFYSIYSRLLPDLAVVLLVVTLYKIYRKRIRILFRFIRLLYLDKKELLMSPRARVPLMAASAVILLILLVPFSRETISVETVLEPGSVARLEAPEQARIARVLIREGDDVAAGQAVAQLTSEALLTEEKRLTGEMERLMKDEDDARARGDMVRAYTAEQKLEAAREALAGTRARASRMELRSPVKGRVLSSHIEEMEGNFVRAGTPIAVVGDTTSLLARLPVPERLLSHVAPGQRALIQLVARPLQLASATIRSISPAGTSEQARTAEDLAGPAERPERFIALAVVDNRDGSLLPGMVGKAKIYSRRSSIAARGWRIARDWVRATVW